MSWLTTRRRRCLPALAVVVLLVGTGVPVGAASSALACRAHHIVVSPGNAEIAAGDSIAYTVEAFDARGNSLGDVTADTDFHIPGGAGGSWSGGTYTSERAGRWKVRARHSGRTDRAYLTVNAGPPGHITLSPESASITAGDSQAFTAEAFGAAGNSLGDVSASTTFSIDAAAGGSWTGNVYTSEQSGTWTVTGSHGSHGSHDSHDDDDDDRHGSHDDHDDRERHDDDDDRHGSHDSHDGRERHDDDDDRHGSHDSHEDTVTLTVTAAALNRFVFGQIASPQTAGVPFAITIRAVDAHGNTVAGYEGTAALTDLSGSLSPTPTASFNAGSWTGDVSIANAYAGDSITAVDEADGGITGTSNAFDVEAVRQSIDIEKSTNGHDADTAPGPTLAAGEVVTWTYTVRNTGDVDLYDVVVTDDQGVSVSMPSSSLRPGESMAGTALGTVLEGQYRNVGTVTASTDWTEVSDSDPSHYFGEYSEAADLAVAKSDSEDPVTAGDSLTYTVTVTNHGPDDAAGVTVTDALPQDTSLDLATPSVGTVSELNGVITWTVGDLAHDAAATLTLDVTVGSETQGTISNTAEVSGAGTDPNPGNNTATEDTSVVPPAKYDPVILVTKTGPASAYVYDTVTYTITLAHDPASDGSPVYIQEVRDDITDDPIYVSGDDGDGVLEQGETWTYEVAYQVQPDDPDPLVNTVTARGNDPEGEAVEDTDTHGLDILHYDPVILVTKTGPASAYVHDTVTYTITLAHDPTSDGSPVYIQEVRDDITDDPIYVSGDDDDGVLEQGETWTYEVAYQVQPDDPDPLVNTVTARGYDSEGEAVEATDTHTLDTDIDGSEPDIAVSPGTISFGSVTVGLSSTPRAVTITNAGTADLTLGSLYIHWESGDGPSGQITIDSDSASDKVLIPGASAEVTVVFSPTSTGTKSASLRVPSDDPDDALVSVSLTGTGVSAAVGGLVFDDTDEDGLKDAGESGIMGVTVELVNGGTHTATTASDGSYSFQDVLPGPYTVRETDPDGYTSTTPNEVPVEVTVGSQHTVDFGDRIPAEPPPDLSYIVISPEAAAIVAGEVQAYGAEAFDDDGSSLGDVTPETSFSTETGAGGQWVSNVYASQLAGVWAVTGTYQGKSATATLSVAPGRALRFQFRHVPGPQVPGAPFALTIQAVDTHGNRATDYAGTAVLTDLTGTILPGTTGSFVSGIWAGSAVISRAMPRDFITATDTADARIQGTSNRFDVADSALATSEETLELIVDFLGGITRQPISEEGVLLGPLVATSPDGAHELRIEGGTTVLDGEGNIARMIVIRETAAPAIPEDAVLLGNAYSFRPSGTTFSDPMFLLLEYDVGYLPENAVSVAVSYYLPETGWTALDAVSGVVAGLGEQTAWVNHFTTFAVLARIAEPAEAPPPPPGLTAEFELGNLSVTPSVSEIWDFLPFIVRTGETATVTFDVTNRGTGEGSYAAGLRVDGKPGPATLVQLGPGRTQTVVFTVEAHTTGRHVVEIDGLSGEFRRSNSANWGLILVLPAALILLCLLVWRLVRRRRARAAGAVSADPS